MSTCVAGASRRTASPPRSPTPCARLEERTGKRFGDPADPLLVSVRSGAAISMPGMMDTILNLGLNDEAVEGLARATGNERFAFDAYRRLVQMFGDVVAGVDGQRFEQELAALKAERGVTQDVDLGADDLRELVSRFQALYPEFPQDARAQLERSSARSSTPGRRRARRCTGGRTASRTTSARPSTSSRWSSGTRATTRHRRRLHARSLDRGAGPLGRVPRQRAG